MKLWYWIQNNSEKNTQINQDHKKQISNPAKIFRVIKYQKEKFTNRKLKILRML